MRATDHSWSTRKQHLHLQSVTGISHHSALSEDRIQQCVTPSGSHHRDTDQCLYIAISFYRHRNDPVLCKNSSVETTVVAEEGQNLVAELWGCTSAWINTANAIIVCEQSCSFDPCQLCG